jgi:hypothetical protein
MGMNSAPNPSPTTAMLIFGVLMKWKAKFYSFPAVFSCEGLPMFVEIQL